MGVRIASLPPEQRVDADPRRFVHDPVSSLSRHLADRLGVTPAIQGFETRRVRAALLLTDVVDFSGHVDRVSDAGALALEQLAHDFDGYFSELVTIVDQCGGDVLSIAGDALLSYWPAEDDEDLARAVGHAIDAGLALQSALARSRFKTRAGPSAGEIDLALAGGVDGRWELMPAGDPVAAVARAERLAIPGTVALDESAWSRL